MEGVYCKEYWYSFERVEKVDVLLAWNAVRSEIKVFGIALYLRNTARYYLETAYKAPFRLQWVFPAVPVERNKMRLNAPQILTSGLSTVCKEYWYSFAFINHCKIFYYFIRLFKIKTATNAANSIIVAAFNIRRGRFDCELVYVRDSAMVLFLLSAL